MLSLCGERLTPKVLDYYLHHDLIMLQLRLHEVNYCTWLLGNFFKKMMRECDFYFYVLFICRNAMQ